MKINGVQIFASLVTLAVAVIVILGFVMAGSPNKARARNADQSRVDHLQQISSAIDAYWNANKALPPNLEALGKSQNVYIQNINDPVTGALYGFNAVSATTYELCANFETQGNQPAEYAIRAKPALSAPYDQIMNHDIGYQCFVLSVNNWNQPTVK